MDDLEKAINKIYGNARQLRKISRSKYDNETILTNECTKELMDECVDNVYALIRLVKTYDKNIKQSLKLMLESGRKLDDLYFKWTAAQDILGPDITEAITLLAKERRKHDTTRTAK